MRTSPLTRVDADVAMFGRHWTDTPDLLVLGDGPCAACGRTYARRYEWQGAELCIWEYYRERLEAERLAGWEADRRLLAAGVARPELPLGRPAGAKSARDVR